MEESSRSRISCRELLNLHLVRVWYICCQFELKSDVDWIQQHFVGIWCQTKRVVCKCAHASSITLLCCPCSGKVDETKQAGFSGDSFLCWFWSSCWFLQVGKLKLSSYFSCIELHPADSAVFFNRFLVFPNMGQSLQSVMEEEEKLLSETAVLHLACRIVGVTH